MGMFGKNTGNILQILGAALKDASPGSEGGNLAGIQQMQMQQAELMRQRQLAQQAAGLFAPQRAQAPVANADGEDISAAFGSGGSTQAQRRDPREMIAQLMPLIGAGLKNPDAYLKGIEGMSPKAMNVAGRVIDERDPNSIGQFYGEAPTKGAEPVYDRQGKEVGWRMADGALQAIGSAKEAESLGGAMGSFQTVPDGHGGTNLKTGRQFMGEQGQDGVGYAPPAAQLAADKMTAEAGAQGRIDLPQNLQTAQSTLDVLEQLKNHPGRKLATGATGMLPGIPGTVQKDFVTMLEQAKGKTFLEAFATLKGGGQITEVEGRKAQDAIARLDRTQSEEGFVAALNDLEGIVRKGMERSQQRATLGAPQAQRPAAAPRTTGFRSRILSVQ